MDKHENEGKQQFLWLNRILPEFMKIYREEKNKQPYHINLIDELHIRASENAHSRILAKLLQQKSPDGKFEILESFIRYLTEKSGTFGNIKVEKPIITQEKERIDLCIIEEKNYAIIIENKINYASDQEKQLERYINSVRQKYCIDLTQIFIIYLAHDDKDLDNQTLGEYKDKIEKRLLKLSFRDDVLSWLSNSVLPNVRLKDEFLSSALQQYIDHLKGMFNLREIDKVMNKELQEYIKKELGLNDLTSEQSIEKLNEKKEVLNKIIYQIDLLTSSLNLELAKKYISECRCRIKYPENFYDQFSQCKEDEHVLAVLPEIEKNFSTVLWYDENSGHYYYGISTWYSKNDLKILEEVKPLVQKIEKELNLKGCLDISTACYIKCPIGENEDPYSKFEQLLEKVIETVNKK